MAVVRGYRPSLDGLRAVAVAGVVAQHAGLTSLNAGALGVDIFFVLSGYLITGNLLVELTERKNIALKAFYIRRAARLYPALLVLLVVGSFALVAQLDEPAAPVVRGAIIAGTYVTDLATFGHSAGWSVFGNTWTLAVEEHFYLLWPAVLLLCRRRDLIMRVAVVGAILSFLFLELQARSGPGAPYGPPLTYFQPQTHAAGLLLGAAVACLPERWSWRGRLSMPLLIATGALMVFGPDWSVKAYYQFSIAAVWLLTAGLLLSLEKPSTAQRVLSWMPLRHVGSISYGIYLYHQFVFLLLSRHLVNGRYVQVSHSLLLLLQVVGSIAVAEVSYFGIERPLRVWVRSRLPADPLPLRIDRAAQTRS